MLRDNLYLYIFAGLLVVLVILFLFFKRNKTKSTNQLPFDLELLVEYLGKKDNIITARATISRISIELKDNSLVKVEQIKLLGASGIVEKSTGYTFIFGQVSLLIEQQLLEYLKA